MDREMKRAALSLGVLFAILHFVGVLLIALSGGSLVEWKMTTHHVKVTATYLPLDVVNLIIGTIEAAIVGAVIGALFVVLWNKFGEMK